MYWQTPKDGYLNSLKFCMQISNYSDDSTYESEIKRILGFNGSDDMFKFRSAIDLCEDTNNALANYFKYRFHSRDSDRISEKYLRIYGVFNAIFLMRSSIYTIGEMTKFSELGKLKNILNAHKAIEIRNITSAHSLNHFGPMGLENKFDRSTKFHYKINYDNFFSDASSITIVGGPEGSQTINLHNHILDFVLIIDKYLGEIALDFLNKTSRFSDETAIFIEIKNEISHHLKCVFDYDSEYFIKHTK